MNRRWFYIVSICAAAVSSGMLLYALYGSPSYAFFGPLKVVVAGSSLVAAITCLMVSPWLTPVSIGLLATGYVEMFGQMRRAEWEPWNQASVAFLAIAIVTAIYGTRVRRDA